MQRVNAKILNKFHVSYCYYSFLKHQLTLFKYTNAATTKQPCFVGNPIAEAGGLQKPTSACCVNMEEKKTNVGHDSFEACSLEETLVPAKAQPRWHLLATFSSLCILALMVALDATSLPVALPVSCIARLPSLLLSLPSEQQLNNVQVISKDLGGSAVEAFWSATSFLLASTVFQPIIAAFSNLYGRKALMNVSLVFFFVGSVVIAAGKNFTTVIIGRTVQGSGGGGITCLTTLIIVDKIPLRERGKWISLVGAMFSIGTVTGPLLGK